MKNQKLDRATHNKLVSFIWSIADDCLRDVYVRGKYRDIILPMTVIRRFDAILEPEKKQILELKEIFIKNQAEDLESAMGLAIDLPFYNISQFTLKDLKNETSAQNLKKNFKDYLDGFSPNVRDILNKFKFYNQLDTMSEAGILGSVIEKFVSAEINLSPYPVLNSNDEIILPALDNHTMGVLFEELIRKFNEENNEEAGEHFTPRDVVELMADIAIVPVADQLKDAPYTLYDGAAGTLGMCTVAVEKIEKVAEQRGKNITTHIYGQEINPETYAIAKADMLVKGQGQDSDNIFYGSTISNDFLAGDEFDFMLSNPPYGKNWKIDLEKIGAGTSKSLKDNVCDPRFVTEHNGEADFRMLPDVSDGQLLFLLNNISKMKDTDMGSRIVEVHNGSALYAGGVGNGSNNARKYMIEHDLIEAIIQLPTNIFYNTAIPTYLWVLSNRKENRKSGKIQLIDASSIKTTLRKNMGKKNCELNNDNQKTILDIFLNYEENEYSKILNNEEFGYYEIQVERPLRKSVRIDDVNLQKFYKILEKLGIIEGNFDKSKIYTIEDEVIKTTKAAINEFSDVEKMRTYYDVMNDLKSVHEFLSYIEFEEEFNKRAKGKKGVTLSNLEKTGILDLFVMKNPLAEVIRDNKGKIIPDANLREIEQIPFSYDGGIKRYFENEVLRYHNDAWYEEDFVQTGYEINFTKYFYKPDNLTSFRDLLTELEQLDSETENVIDSIMEGLRDEI